MAAPTDATFARDFDPAAFRAAITQTMIFGSPNAVEERATFRWRSSSTHSIADTGGTPYDLTSTPVAVVEKDDVQVPCAVEFSARSSLEAGTAVGLIEEARVQITLLDVHYVQIHGSDEVVIGHNLYNVDFIAPPVGLGTVTVYTIFATAVDET